jgi:hypothetical protein
MNCSRDIAGKPHQNNTGTGHVDKPRGYSPSRALAGLSDRGHLAVGTRRGGHRGSNLGYFHNDNISGLAFSAQRYYWPDNDVLVETGAGLLVVAALGRTCRRGSC